MKTIKIRAQLSLGIRRLIRITLDGIRYRLFRSAVTLAVVATALAFLMNMTTEALIRKAIGTAARMELQERRLQASQRAVATAGSDGAIGTTIDAYLRLPEIRQLLAGHLNVLPTDLTPEGIWGFLESSSGAAWLEVAANKQGLQPPPCPAAELRALARDAAHEVRLVEVDRRTADLGSGLFGLGTRMVWLMCVSLLVCAIGIMNAMLMSVTERFREIATMKCLGAVDGGIMAIFVLESCLLGLTGGLIGGVMGIIIGTGRVLTALGWTFIGALPLKALGLALLGSLGIGIILSAIAAVYPAWKAARLAPMEAMRIQ